MKHVTKTLLAATAASALFAGSANAATILIDFGTSGGAAPSNFNTVASASVTDLNASDGSPTAVDISVDTSAANAGFTGGNTGGPSGGGTDPFLDAGVLNDGIFASKDASFTITFSDLLASTQYDFQFINGRSSGAGAGVAIITVGTGTGSGGTAAADGTLLDLSVVSDASGVISFTVADDTDGGQVLLAAMSITEVPEPGSLALLAAGGLMIGARRRRK